MCDEWSGLEVDGVAIRRGTSIYHRNVNRVMWFDEIEDGFVKLGSVEGMIEIDLETFREHISNGTLNVETDLGENRPD